MPSDMTDLDSSAGEDDDGELILNHHNKPDDGDDTDDSTLTTPSTSSTMAGGRAFNRDDDHTVGSSSFNTSPSDDLSGRMRVSQPQHGGKGIPASISTHSSSLAVPLANGGKSTGSKVSRTRLISLNLDPSASQTSSTATLPRRPPRAVKNSRNEDDECDEDGEMPRRKKKKPGRKPMSSSNSVSVSPAPRMNSAGVSSIPMPTDVVEVEKILYHRLADVQEEGTVAKDEFLIKYKNASYLHCEWVDRDWLEAHDRRAKQRIKHFLEKTMADLPYSLLSEDRPFSDSYVKIDRIIAARDAFTDPLTGNVTDWFLVKWCALPYDSCTWETRESLLDIAEDGELHIELYEKRSKLPHVRDPSFYKLSCPPGIRPPAASWAGYNESPEYKDGNTLRTYQLEGLNWLLYCWYHGQSSLIADEMGLGKTVQSVSFLNELYTKVGVRGPFLIIAPLSTIPHWERTVTGWTDMNCVVFHGSASSRNIIQNYEYYYNDRKSGARVNLVAPPEMIGKTNAAALKMAYNQFKFDIMITTYEMAMNAANALKNVGLWRVVVVDEAHRLKNKSSKVGEVLKSYQFEHRLLLTGTPIQNSLEELWSILNFLDSVKFPDNSEKQFLSDYDLRSAADVERLQNILKPLMLRRLKEDVEKSIPVKEETIVEVELTDIQRAYYKAILERNFPFLKQGTKRNNMPNLINAMMELRKCCIHPYLIRGAEEKVIEDNKAVTPQEQFDCMIQASGKLVLLSKLLPKLKAGNHKVLIFSQMTRCLDLLGDYLRGSGYRYERIDGTVRGESRQSAIDRFSAPDSDIFAFLLCTRAGGVGINLTAADTCIIFDSDWNPQNDLQAQARCHRIGQKKNVKIYRLITRNTYERTMFDKAGMKLGLDRAVLSRMDFDASESTSAGGPPSSLSKHEIEELLRKGAYAALDMDGTDDDSKNFCSEDIDSILERRTQTIVHNGEDAGGEKVKQEGSLFSKATFSLENNNTASIDMNDPNFWTKWAEKANVTSAIEEDPMIVVSKSRKRRTRGKSSNFEEDGDDNSRLDGAGSDINEIDTEGWAERQDARSRALREVSSFTAWTMAEKIRIERGLMALGFGCWEKKKDLFPKRSINDIKAVELRLLHWCLAKLRKEREAPVATPRKESNADTLISENDDDQVARQKLRARDDIKSQREDIRLFADVERAICSLRWTVPSIAEVEEMAISDCKSRFDEIMFEVEQHPELGEYPYPGATLGQLMEYRSFLDDASKEYFEHLEKKPRNILARVQSLHFIREQVFDIDPHATSDVWISVDQYTNEMGAPPPDNNGSNWVDKYQRLYQARRDQYVFPENYSQIKEPNVPQSAGWDMIEDRDLLLGMIKLGYQTFDKIREDRTLIFKEKNFVSYEAAKKDPTLSEQFPVWPSGSDIGTRTRKLLSLLGKTLRDQLPAISITDLKENALLNDHCWSKKDRSEFMRAVNCVGIPEPEETTMSLEEAEQSHCRIISSDSSSDNVKAIKREWSAFREAAQLDHKSDYALEQFARLFVRSAEEMVRTSTSGRSIAGDMCVSGRYNGEDLPTGVIDLYNAPDIQLIDSSGSVLEPCSGMALERARRLLRRVVFMRTIRTLVLKDPNLEFKLSFAKKSSGLPDWWVLGEHDRAFLVGVARHGMTPLRQNRIMFDPSLPFRPIVEDKLRAAGMADKLQSLIHQATLTKQEQKDMKKSVAPDADDDNDDDDAPGADGINLEEIVGWPKDLIRSRRVEILSDLVVNPSHKAMNMIQFFGKDSADLSRRNDEEYSNIDARALTFSNRLSSGRSISPFAPASNLPLTDEEKSVVDKSLQRLKDTIAFIESHAMSRELVQFLRQHMGEDSQAVTEATKENDTKNAMDVDYDANVSGPNDIEEMAVDSNVSPAMQTLLNDEGLE